MSLKLKIIFYNFMIFLIIFDIIYLFVWIFSIHMNPTKAILVALSAAVLMPWARPTHAEAGRKVEIRSIGYIAYKKYVKKEV